MHNAQRALSRCITRANEGPRPSPLVSMSRVHGDASEVKIAYFVIALLISAISSALPPYFHLSAITTPCL